jgi:hypothetical protein
MLVVLRSQLSSSHVTPSKPVWYTFLLKLPTWSGPVYFWTFLMTRPLGAALTGTPRYTSSGNTAQVTA